MSTVSSHEKEKAVKIIARSLIREMSAQGYDLRQMVVLISEIIDLILTRHDRLSGCIAPEERHLPAALEESRPRPLRSRLRPPWQLCSQGRTGGDGGRDRGGIDVPRLSRRWRRRGSARSG